MGQAMRRAIRHTIFKNALLLAIALASPSLYAGSLDSSVLGMFPKDVTQIGYADLSEARELPWFPQFEAQAAPVSLYEFERFLEAAQLQQTPVITQVAWGRIDSAIAMTTPAAAIPPGAGQLLGVGLGHFDTDAILSAVQKLNLNSIKDGETTLYAAGIGSGVADTYFALVSDGVIAFGTEASLRRLVNTSSGGEPSVLTNEAMMTMIGQVNGSGTFWHVARGAGSQSILGQVLPDSSKAPQIAALLATVKSVSINVSLTSVVQVAMEAEVRSASDARLLAQLSQLALLYRQQQMAGSGSDAKQVFSGAQVSPNGSRVEISFQLTNDQLQNLIEHNLLSGM